MGHTEMGNGAYIRRCGLFHNAPLFIYECPVTECLLMISYRVPKELLQVWNLNRDASLLHRSCSSRTVRVCSIRGNEMRATNPWWGASPRREAACMKAWSGISHV